MKRSRVFSSLFQALLFLVSIFFVVPLSLVIGLPVLIALFIYFFTRLLHPALTVLALFLMGCELAFLLSWSFGFTIALFALMFLLFSWTRSSRKHPGVVFLLECGIEAFFLFVLAFFIHESSFFWMIQILCLLGVQVAWWFERRAHVWPTRNRS